MDGYIVNLGGLKLFQPCEDSATSVFEALDNRSFVLSINNINDLYFEAIDNIGDSVIVTAYDTSGKEKYLEKFSSFYCTLEVAMFFLDLRKFTIFKEPYHTIYFKEKKYYLEGFDIENMVRKIIPHEKRNLMMMYNFYKNKGYSEPPWLDKIVNTKVAK